MDTSCTTNGSVLKALRRNTPRPELADLVTLPQNSRLSKWIHDFEVPAFVPHRLLRGGHLQTLVSTRSERPRAAATSLHQRHTIRLPDGDAIVMHDDQPVDWLPAGGSVLLLHGICGYHAASYMVRFSQRLHQRGIRTFRLDMRGCGDSAELCRTITHAGRSEDVLAAIESIGRIVPVAASPIGAVGVSLGGNQLLLMAGRVGSGAHQRPSVWDRVGPILSIAPPLDLQACSDAMQALRLRFYNWYFIKHLLRRASPLLRAREDYQAMLRLPRPKTLREFDRAFTAPLAGFASEQEYYRESSAISVLDNIDVPTLIVAAADDPLVPVESFRWHGVDGEGSGPGKVRLHVAPAGGHHGFLQQDGTSWSDDLVSEFFSEAFALPVKIRALG